MMTGKAEAHKPRAETQHPVGIKIVEDLLAVVVLDMEAVIAQISILKTTPETQALTTIKLKTNRRETILRIEEPQHFMIKTSIS